MVLLAVTQMTSSTLISSNAATACSLISRAAAAGAKAVFLPEATDFIAPSNRVAELARSRDNADFVRRVRDAARRDKVWVSVGIHEPVQSSEEEEGSGSGNSSSSDADARGRCYNTQLLVDDLGEVRTRYRKTHLFDVDIQGGMRIKESDTTIPGERVESPVQCPVGKVGLLTCYDLRFPEASLHLRRLASDVLTYPSAFTMKTGAAHWHLLLRARAVETQCYVVAAAQVGRHPDTKRESYGHALVVDPWGRIVAECAGAGETQTESESEAQASEQCDGGSFALADVDLAALASIRREMPLWEQRRFDLYPQL